jgi:hypothetical protein
LTAAAASRGALLLLESDICVVGFSFFFVASTFGFQPAAQSFVF